MSETLERKPATRWSPQPGPQADAIAAYWVSELLFGGARGGGKSDFLLGDWLQDAQLGAVWRGVLFRQSYPELEELIARSQVMVPQCSPGAEWFKQEKTWRLKNGATLRMRSLEAPEDAAHYQGHEYTWIGWDELAAWKDSKPYHMLMATLRSSADVPHKRVRASANPGGPGHAWVKARFIDPFPHGYQLIKDEMTGLERMFIPSRITDNKILMARDPAYVDRLRGVGSPELVRAWLEGDWSAVVGSYFPEFGPQHIIRPFEIPSEWLRFRAMDWGSARPFCVHWFAVSDGIHPGIPTGALVLYREWYGASGPNVGLRLTAEQVAEGISLRERQDMPMAYGVADPAMFTQDGGPSIGERMAMRGVRFKPADNRRVGKLGASGGWDAVRQRLIGEDGAPMLYVFSTATEIIRTLPALQHDPVKAEDVDCWVAGTMVATPAGERAIESIQPGDVVDTPIGPRLVTHSYLSGTSETVRVLLSNGRTLEGTPRHKIYAKGRGLIALSDLKCHMVLRERIIWSRSLNIVVSSIAATKAASTIIRAAACWLRARVQACIARFGLMPEIPYRMAGTSITLMATTTTTTSPTWSASAQASIAAITCGNVWHRMVTLDNGSRSGVARALGSSSFGRMPQRCGPIHRSGSYRASIVAVLSARDLLCSDFVRRSARNLNRMLFARFARRHSGASPMVTKPREPVHIIAVGKCAVGASVYNLTVADANLFYANGILSANTRGEDHAADCCRYACMSRPWVRATPDVERGLTMERLWEYRDRGGLW